MKKLTVTVSEMAEIMLNTKVNKGVNMFAYIVQETMPKVTKKDRLTKEPNPYNEIKKISILSVLLNSDYKRALELQLKREEKPTTDYKQGVNTMPIELCENNDFFGTYEGKFVVQYRPNDGIKAKSYYFADGKNVKKKEIENFLPLPQKAQNQGTEREIFWRKVYLTNIKQISFNKVRYTIIQD